jgi:carboxymethylenebutenolidase
MRLALFFLAALFGNTALSQQIDSALLVCDTVSFPSGKLQLKGLLWKPVSNKPVPAILFNHGSEYKALKYLARIAPAFLQQGYAFFVPFRRGQGLSQGQGKYISDELDSANKAGGSTARTALMITLHETTQLDDQLAALAFLKQQSGIDSTRIVAAGISFGGIQALMIATKPHGIKAVLDFAGAAMNWEKAPEVPVWLTNKMSEVKVPVYLIQAANDFSTKPSTELAAVLEKLGKPYAVKVYPPFGKEAMDGHSFVDAYTIWGPDVFPLLRQWIEKK